ncbi:glycosyltransferase [Salinimicrobium tongyeongense]|uniref:Glycosyltransferase n=1 Tax=Salinimicrobium tongyeongense TaxID=2809707 RepID=A0ABY6NRG1_9FLAO|nr:glycosyltransferase [Salinimicrobium tongyeongense]UZH55502.1 glycosyltransferase [Salinimicrobium tongyeongense]
MNLKEFKDKYQKVQVEHFQHSSTDTPEVSVLVQTFNHGSYLEDCLKGILEQKTDFLIEIILGEDNSTDNTIEICRDYAKKFPEKIRLFLHHPSNKIKILGRTTGNFNAFYNLLNARGKYIAFCEGDDVWMDPYKIQKQVDLLKTGEDFAFTYHSFLEVREDLQLIPQENFVEQPRKNIKSIELKKLIYHPLLSTVCFKNFFKEQIPEEIIEVLNVDSCIISILGNYGCGYFQSEINSSLYRRHEGGIWSKKSKFSKYKSKILTYSKLKKFYSNRGDKMVSQYFEQKIKWVQKMHIAGALKSGSFYVAIRAYMKMLLKNY